MKSYETYEKKVETREFKYISSITCDICGKKYNDNWNVRGFAEMAETEIRYKEGSNYPDGGYGTETTIDICPTCFKEKLIPWVKAQGGTPTVTDWDW